MTNIDKLLQQIENNIDDLINQGKQDEAYNIVSKIQDFYYKLGNKFNADSKVRGIFFEEDDYLINLNLNEKLKQLFNKIKEKYWDYMLDEVVFMKSEDGDVKPIYYFTINQNQVQKIDLSDINEFKKDILENLKFFIDNIINADLLEDGETSVTGEWEGEEFDLVLNIGNYIIGFNNTEESMDTLKDKYDVKENDLIEIVSELYYDFK